MTTYDIYLNIDSRTSMESTRRETTRNNMVPVVTVLKKEPKQKHRNNGQVFNRIRS